MPTSFDIPNNRFLNKISDSYLLQLEEESLETLIDGYRMSAHPKFKQCKKLNNRDEDLRIYMSDLTDEEVEILVSLMVLEWLRPQINSIELLKQSMSTKDYSLYSQANHLKELKDLFKDTQAEINKLIVAYTFSENKLNNLKG